MKVRFQGKHWSSFIIKAQKFEQQHNIAPQIPYLFDWQCFKQELSKRAYHVWRRKGTKPHKWWYGNPPTTHVFVSGGER